jgi:uncharacterized protein (TIGR02145 family)
MKKALILFSLFCLVSCDKDALIPVGTGNAATVEITGISSVGFNSAVVGLSVNYPTGRTLKSIGVQSNSFTYVQAVTNTPVPNGNKQTLNVNVNLSNLSPNQNYLVKPFADISAGESNYTSNLNIKFLGMEKPFQTQSFPSATGYLNFQFIKTNWTSVGFYYPSSATDFDLLLKNQPLINSGTILINTQKPNLINWSGYEQLNSILKSAQIWDEFALVITGYFVPLETGSYVFSIEGDDAQELSLNDKVIIGSYGGTSAFPIGTHTTTINLIRGNIYPLKIRMQETFGGEALSLFWKKPSNQANWIQDANELRSTLSGELSTGSAVNTVVSKTGRIWMDRNLGAIQVATTPTDALAYGDLYQWGRGADGHQIRTSGATTNLSASDKPGNNLFIIAGQSPWDWRSPQNNSLWQGPFGVNNVCPTGFRLPTVSEWDAERATWSSNNSSGGFASPLKLTLGGFRHGMTNSLNLVSTAGHYWTSTTNGFSFPMNLDISPNTAWSNNYDGRSHGLSVRCIKD